MYSTIHNGRDNKILDLLFSLFGFRMFGKELTMYGIVHFPIQKHARQKVEDFVIPPGVQCIKVFHYSVYEDSEVAKPAFYK